MIRFEDTNMITVTHEAPYCVAVATWLLEGCITQAIALRKLKRNTLLIKSIEFF